LKLAIVPSKSNTTALTAISSQPFMMDFEASNHACAEIYFAVKPQQRAQTRKLGSLNVPLANRTSFFWGGT
jgi:hypothetical protein